MTQAPIADIHFVDGDILVMMLKGKLDNETAAVFRKEAEGYLDQGVTKIILDCTFLGYCSSAGLAALVFLQTRLRKRGGQVKLAAIQSAVADVIKLVHLNHVLDIYGDSEFARQSFYEEDSGEG